MSADVALLALLALATGLMLPFVAWAAQSDRIRQPAMRALLALAILLAGAGSMIVPILSHRMGPLMVATLALPPLFAGLGLGRWLLRRKATS